MPLQVAAGIGYCQSNVVCGNFKSKEWGGVGAAVAREKCGIFEVMISDVCGRAKGGRKMVLPAARMRIRITKAIEYIRGWHCQGNMERQKCCGVMLLV